MLTQAWRALILVVGLLVLAYIARTFWSQPNIAAQLRDIQNPFRKGEDQEVIRLVDRILEKDPGSLQALQFGYHAAWRLENQQLAESYLTRIVKQGDGVRWAEEYSTRLFQQASLWPAEFILKAIVEADPQNLLSHRLLASVLSLEGRREESLPHIRELIASKETTIQDLLLLGLQRFSVDAPQLREQFSTASDDPGLRLALATHLEKKNQPQLVAELLRPVVTEHPDWRVGQALYGWVLLDLNRKQEFTDWLRECSQTDLSHAMVLAVIGRAAKQSGQFELALASFWHSFQRDPSDLFVCSELSVLLQQDQQLDAAEQLAERSRQLKILIELMDRMSSLREDPELMRRAVQTLDDLGRPLEAAAWAALTAEITQTQSDFEIAQRLQSLIDEHTPFQMPLPKLAVALNERQSDILDPKQLAETLQGSPAQSESTGGDTIAKFRFENQAKTCGIQFSFENGHRDNDADRVFEFTGGGVAVIDYDSDGYSDLYFTQGNRNPFSPASGEFCDALYRNLGNGQFLEVTAQAGIHETSYSQGVSVGDFNADGHPDLLIANLGQNRLYQNDGDGHFTDVTDFANLMHVAWSTSAAIADLNSDGLPDLYVVNYLGDQDAISQDCLNIGSCTPEGYHAAQDQIMINLGDGRFADRTDACGIVMENGKGLGLQIADLEQRGQLDVFVANDTVPNFLFRQVNGKSGLRFEEQALLRGLAFDEAGRTQACMGIAIGDPDRDQDLDMLVTNFYEESNTLYEQTETGFFQDRARQTGLRTPSFLKLGFGTQFIDIDGDGWDDLIVANGHILYETNDGAPTKMQPQCYRNRQGTFEEVPATELGTYFEQPRFGRSLARLDWNRDGRTDFVVSHLESPVALLTNQSEQQATTLQVKLTGANYRDAIGAVAKLKCHDTMQIRQLTAGDGYHCCNERCLTFALPSENAMCTLIVKWPGGREQVFELDERCARLLLQEGRPNVLPLE